jgi:hypothetical protein
VTRLIAILIGVLVGLGIGLLSERVPVRPLFQSIIAAVVGWTVASLASAVVWMLRPPPEAQGGAVSFGLNLAWGTVFILGVALLHAALGWLGLLIHPSAATHRALLVGLLGSLSATIASTSGLGMVGPLR